MAQFRIAGTDSGQIAESVEAAVHRGHLKPGDRLPTVRALSASLRVSPTTIAAAYRRLQVRGIIAANGRHGTRVALRPPSPAVASRAAVPEGIVDLATGNPDPDLLPALDTALRGLDPALRLYDGVVMLPALRTFVTGELQADGVPSAALTLAHGALDAIERVLREHLRAGDGVAVEDPAFPGILELLAANGFVPVPLRLDDRGVVPEALDAALRTRIRAVIVTPRAQNPTGAAFDAGRARDLRALLARHPDVLLVEDDHAGPIAGVPLCTLCDASPRWAFVRSVSKYLGPDLRAAVVAGDRLTVARVEGRLALGPRWVSHIVQQLVLALWSDPSSGRRLARAADSYQQRRAALSAALAERGIAAHGRSGMNVWVPVAEEGHVVRLLLEKGWAVMPGERFRVRAPPAIRVTTAALTPADATRFAGDLARILSERPPPAA